MIKNLIVAVALTASSAAVLADDFYGPAVERQVDLKNGATLYVYKDGKMAAADRLGRPLPIKSGTAVETRDGQRIVINSNEINRLHVTQPSAS